MLSTSSCRNILSIWCPDLSREKFHHLYSKLHEKKKRNAVSSWNLKCHTNGIQPVCKLGWLDMCQTILDISIRGLGLCGSQHNMNFVSRLFQTTNLKLVHSVSSNNAKRILCNGNQLIQIRPILYCSDVQSESIQPGIYSNNNNTSIQNRSFN